MSASEQDSGTGLRVFWANIDAEYVFRYQQWHNCEHVPERVSIPGFLEGRRYRSTTNEPHFLMFYDTKTTATLASEGYMAALNAPTPWTQEALTHFRNPVRSVYSKLAVAGSHPWRFAAPYIITMRFDLPEGGEGDVTEKWAKAVSEVDGVERVRFYRADAAVGNLGTSERKIYGGGPGKQAYLFMIELSVPPERVEDLAKRGDAALGTGVPRANEERGTYWLEIAHRASL